MNQTPHGLRVFTTGHSFHSWVAPLVADLAAAAGIEGHEVVGMAVVGGSAGVPPYLNHHWNIPDEENLTKQALRTGQVDVLTLSPIWLPDPGIANFARLGLVFNLALRVLVQEFWLPNDRFDTTYPLPTRLPVDHNATDLVELRGLQDAYLETVAEVVADANRQVGSHVAHVVPVGHAVLALREKITAGEAPLLNDHDLLFHEGWGHPTPPLQALAAYCFFAAIYGINPVGLPLPKAELHPECWPARAPWRDEALARLMQELAWEAVSPGRFGCAQRPEEPERFGCAQRPEAHGL